MTYDGLFTKKMIEPLQSLVSGRIRRISQPKSDTITIVIGQNRKNRRLLLSTHPSFSRLQLTIKRYDSPFTPPMFVRVFRKHLEGGFIRAIRQVGNNRRVEIDIESKDEIGGTTYRTIISEIIGKHSNLIFVDDQRKIIEGLKCLTPSTNQYRTVMPGFKYEAPPNQNRINPCELIRHEVLKYIDFNAEKIAEQLLDIYEGSSPLIVNEIVDRCQFMTQGTLPDVFDKVMTETKSAPIPVFHKNHGTGKKDFYSMRLNQFYDDVAEYHLLRKLLDRFYDVRGERERVKQRANDLVRLVRQQLQRQQNKLSKLIDEYESTKNKETQQLYGELITANICHIQQDGDSVIALNYYIDEEVKIPFSPTKPPSANAQYYYKQYNRMRTREHELTHQIKLAKESIDYFDNTEQQLKHIIVDNTDDIRDKLAEQGFMKQRKRSERKKQSKIQLQTYHSTDGDTISVGKSNRQNDYLTSKKIRKNHLWFYVKDIPGSHVIILDESPSEATIRGTAVLAGYFSRVGSPAQILVGYTETRHVHRPSEAKPGLVIYDNRETPFATPGYDHIQWTKKL